VCRFSLLSIKARNALNVATKELPLANANRYGQTHNFDNQLDGIRMHTEMLTKVVQHFDTLIGLSD
jgi:hypothetical protein